ncbi:hypothetical protein ACS0TY_000122 [Phlomoides rotata]
MSHQCTTSSFPHSWRNDREASQLMQRNQIKHALRKLVEFEPTLCKSRMHKSVVHLSSFFCSFSLKSVVACTTLLILVALLRVATSAILASLSDSKMIPNTVVFPTMNCHAKTMSPQLYTSIPTNTQ